MGVAAVRLPIPSLLQADAFDWVRRFAVRFRDEVAAPLFGAGDGAAFEALLPDALVRGATLRARWLAEPAGMAEEERRALADWVRPPPPSFLADLRRRA